ncbi:MAG: hydrolase [Nitrospirota bacterium]
MVDLNNLSKVLIPGKVGGLIIVDVQSILLEVINRKDVIKENIVRLIKLAKLYNLPIILTEQYPKWLKDTIYEIKDELPYYDPIDKMEFDCTKKQEFQKRLNDLKGKKEVILTGIETHICIFQTAIGLLKMGYNVHCPQDAVGSRREDNWRVGLDLMHGAGAAITSSETIIFQFLERAGTREFREIMRYVK